MTVCLPIDKTIVERKCDKSRKGFRVVYTYIVQANSRVWTFVCLVVVHRGTCLVLHVSLYDSFICCIYCDFND